MEQFFSKNQNCVLKAQKKYEKTTHTYSLEACMPFYINISILPWDYIKKIQICE
jgi:hypothetical protein